MLPDVNLSILDPGLGLIPANAGNTQVKIGVCTKGAPNTVYGIASVQAARDSLGAGPVVDAAVQALSVAGGTVYVVPTTVGTLGTATAGFTLTGTGTGTVTGSKGPYRTVAVKIGATAGSLGTMKFQVSVNGGAYGDLVLSGTPGPWTYKVPGQYTTDLVFATGTYVAGDIFTVALDGVVTRVGSGTATLLDGSLHSPVDTYAVRVLIVAGGVPGTATFKYSLDGGNSYSGVIATLAGKYVIPDSGVVLTFAGTTFVAGDLFVGTATAATFSNSTDIDAAMTALLANANDWGFVHVVQEMDTAANAATLAAAVAAKMTTAETGYRYVFAIVEAPWDAVTNTDAVTKSAFTSLSNARVMVCAAACDLVSPLTGRTDKRNIAWAVAARLAAVTLSTNPAEVDLAGLSNVRSIYRNEAATPGLDDYRFTTLRTFLGLPGYFVTNPRMMAANGSDYTYVMNRRVMDRACQIARSAYLLFVNRDVRVSATTGYIDERDAKVIDANVNAKMEAALTGEVSSVVSALSRTDNLLSTSTAYAQVSVVPKAYFQTINVSLGFKNPVLQ
jgi:hypothetical protein